MVSKGYSPWWQSIATGTAESSHLDLQVWGRGRTNSRDGERLLKPQSLPLGTCLFQPFPCSSPTRDQVLNHKRLWGHSCLNCHSCWPGVTHQCVPWTSFPLIVPPVSPQRLVFVHGNHTFPEESLRPKVNYMLRGCLFFFLNLASVLPLKK